MGILLKKLLEKKQTDFDGVIGYGSFIEPRPRISTGSLSLDLKLGGGLPSDRVIEYFGKPSCYKTTMALIAMHNYVEMFGYDRPPFIVDLERSITADFVRSFDLDPNKILVLKPRTAEAALDALADLISTGEVSFGIFDSVDALESAKESDRSMSEVGMMEVPKMMSRLMRKLCKLTIDNNCGVIFINQVRANPSPYASPEVTSGGNALPYYAHARIKWAAKPSKETVGAHNLTPNIIKNKTAPLVKAESEFEIIPGKGVLRFKDYLNASKQLGVIVQKGRIYQVMNGDIEIVKVSSAEELSNWARQGEHELIWRGLITNKYNQIATSLHADSTEEEETTLVVE